MGITISQIILLIAIIIVAIAGWDYRRGRDKKLLSLQRELAKEKEKLRLLKLMHPVVRDEDGWTYAYDPLTRLIGKNHENGKGKQSICEIIVNPLKTGNYGDVDYYGYLIADLLNKNQETS
jgi:hypothetical protein